MFHARLAVPVIALSAATALAGPAADLGIQVSPTGQIFTAEWDHTTSTIGSPERVFAGELTLVAGKVFGDEPGYGGPAGSFASAGTLQFNLTRQLRQWNGSGFDFSSVRLNVEDDGGSFSVWSPALDGDAPSTFTLAVGTSEVHQHYSNYLTAADQLAPAPVGIYLVELTIGSTDLSLATSEPTWLVLNYGLNEADHDAAKEYVEANIVPAPASAALLGLAGLLAARRRR